MVRDTCPCRHDTAFARREVFSASTVMQKVSPWSWTLTRPSAIRPSCDSPSASRSGPRCSSIMCPSNRSCPAGTGVCVVNTVIRATRRSASSKPIPSACIRSRIISSPANALWPSFRWRTPGRDLQRAQRPDAADAQEQFLANADAVVAAVEPRRE